MLPELDRVMALGKREPVTEEQIDQLSALLRVRTRNDRGEVNRLRAGQVQALRELYDVRGLLGPIPVGCGKTLITMLAPTLLGSSQPVLLIPASLREKTRRDFVGYAADWKVTLPTLLSYTEMSLASRERRLFELMPDLLMLDEADDIRNYDNACARRVERYVLAHRPIYVALSGTLITDQFEDYQHHSYWALGERSPLPTHRPSTSRWQEHAPPDVAAHALTVRGVVPLQGSGCDASIRISTWEPTLPPILQDTIADVTESGLRPDGEPLNDWALPDCLYQLVMGYYLVWDPLPPTWWLQPRRAWNAYLRAIKQERIEGFDTDQQVVRALEQANPSPRPPGYQEGRHLLSAWRTVREKFEPNSVPVWLSEEPLRQVAKRAKRGTLIWTNHVAEGEMLQSHGIAYFGADNSPELAPAGHTIAVSIDAHHRGCNLQHGWSRNLILAMPADNRRCEQLIGRTHRQGQKAPVVDVEVVCAVPHQRSVLSRLQAQARRVAAHAGFEQKLSLADWSAAE